MEAFFISFIYEKVGKLDLLFTITQKWKHVLFWCGTTRIYTCENLSL